MLRILNIGDSWGTVSKIPYPICDNILVYRTGIIKRDRCTNTVSLVSKISIYKGGFECTCDSDFTTIY